MSRWLPTILGGFFILFLGFFFVSNFRKNAWSQQKALTSTSTVKSKPSSKRTAVRPPLIVEKNISETINYYPEYKLSEKTTNILLVLAGSFLITGLSLIEPKLFSVLGKQVNEQINFRESLFRFINRML